MTRMRFLVTCVVLLASVQATARVAAAEDLLPNAHSLLALDGGFGVDSHGHVGGHGDLGIGFIRGYLGLSELVVLSGGISRPPDEDAARIHVGLLHVMLFPWCSIRTSAGPGQAATFPVRATLIGTNVRCDDDHRAFLDRLGFGLDLVTFQVDPRDGRDLLRLPDLRLLFDLAGTARRAAFWERQVLLHVGADLLLPRYAMTPGAPTNEAAAVVELNTGLSAVVRGFGGHGEAVASAVARLDPSRATDVTVEGRIEVATRVQTAPGVLRFGVEARYDHLPVPARAFGDVASAYEHDTVYVGVLVGAVLWWSPFRFADVM